MNWHFGDHVNTDLITPGRYNTTTDPQQLARIAFIEYRPDFAGRVRPGDWIVAGFNFGCGSSRETAVIALKACGIAGIVAKSFSRIFYRNCINHGLPAVAADGSMIGESDTLKLDLDRRVLRCSGTVGEIPVFIPDVMVRLIPFGGMIPYLQQKGLEALPDLFRKEQP